MIKGWHWLYVADWNWSRLGLGVEVSIGFWWPREWSAYLHVGPLLVGGGLEQDLGYDE